MDDDKKSDLLPQKNSNATLDRNWKVVPWDGDEEVEADWKRGRTIKEAARQGGRKRQKPDRDRQMALEFQKRKQKTNLSDTALATHIGKKYGLRRSAAIEAIKRGNK